MSHNIAKYVAKSYGCHAAKGLASMTNIGISQDVLSIIESFVEEAITSMLEERNAVWRDVLWDVKMVEFCDGCEKYREQDLWCTYRGKDCDTGCCLVCSGGGCCLRRALFSNS